MSTKQPRGSGQEQISTGDLILAIEAAKTGIAALTELRQELISKGWTEQGAESMVYAMLTSSMQKG